MPPTTPARPSAERLRALHFADPEGRVLRPLGTEVPDHFAVFGLPPRLLLDADALRDTFLDLSRHFHPDFHANDAPALRDEILRRSSLLNNAYKTLRDDQKRAEYLIALVGRGIESNKNAVPPELLEEIFDIQEAGEELRDARLSTDEERLAAAEARIGPLRDQVNTARQALVRQLEQQCAAYDDALATGADPASDACQQTLRSIRLTLDRMNYLRTVLRNLR